MCSSHAFRVINSAPDDYTRCESVSCIMPKATSLRHILPFPTESIFLKDGEKAVSLRISRKYILIKENKRTARCCKDTTN